MSLTRDDEVVYGVTFQDSAHLEIAEADLAPVSAVDRLGRLAR